MELKARNLAQVSMNLTDFETTSMATVFEAVTREAAALGVQVVGSEIVGLVPRQALDNAAVHLLRVENFRPELIVENRLEQVRSDRARSPALRLFSRRAVGLHTPTPRCGRWSRTL